MARPLSDFVEYDRHFCSQECYAQWRSRQIPNWRRRVVNLTCDYCGSTFTRLEAFVGRYEHNFCSRDCQHKWHSERMSGPNNPHWQGGASFEPYPPEFNITLKRRLRERDDHTCALCGGSGRDVHHIDGNKANNSDSNLITLCRSCHSRITACSGEEEKEWMLYFQELVKSR